MNPLEQLLDVQALDIRLDQLDHRRAGLPERELLQEAEMVLATIRGQIETQETVVLELTREQRRIEDQVTSLEAKVADIDRQLYGGSVSNARELQDLQAELDSVKRHLSSVEDDDLAALERLEPAEKKLATLLEQRTAIEAHRDQAEMSLTAAVAEVDAEIEDVRHQRATAVSEVPNDQLAEYDRLRSLLDGVAIARLAHNRCEGCHLTLASVELDRIRHLDPEELVHCQECGRILVR